MSQKPFLLLSCIALILLQCQKNETPSPGGDLVYSSKTLVAKASFQESLIDSSFTSGLFTFSPSAFDKKPIPGQVLLFPGEWMGKVESIQENSVGEFVIKTSPATLPDVLKEGKIAWEMTPEWTDITSIQIGSETRNARIRAGYPINFSISHQGIDHKITISPIPSSGKITSCTFRFEMSKKVNGRATVAIVGEGKATLPEQQTSISIANSQLKEFTSQNRSMQLEMNVSLTAAGGEPGEHNLILPGIALIIPLRTLLTPAGPIPNPIPMNLKIGVNFVTQFNMSHQIAAASAKSQISVDADGGFTYTSGDIQTQGELKKNEVTGGNFDSSAPLGIPVDMQFGIAFPRLSLDIAGEELAYIHTGATSGTSLSWGPLCKTGYTKVLVEGGYKLQVLGQTLAENKVTFAERRREAKGEGCP